MSVLEPPDGHSDDDGPDIDSLIDAEYERQREAKFEAEAASLYDRVIGSVAEIADTQDMTGFQPCDRCSARATIRVTKGDLELVFCGHHGTEAAPALEAQGWDGGWIDQPS